jgi:hypothetical protein
MVHYGPSRLGDAASTLMLSSVRQQREGSKRFFFEKKKQKTFMTLAHKGE